jgi:hypothetical protein
LGILENRQTNDKHVEGRRSDKKSCSTSQDIKNMSEGQKLRKWVGVGQAGRVAKAAFVATLAFTGMSAAMADQFQNVSNGSLSEGGFNNLSHETALYNLGMRDQDIQKIQQQSPQDIQNDQPYNQQYDQFVRQRREKQEERQLAKEAHEKSDVLEGLSKLFEEIPEEKIATLKAVVEQTGKNPEFAGRVRKLLAESRRLSEQESSETHRRELGLPLTPGASLQWIEPSTVKGTVIPVDGGGTTLGVDYKLNVQNARTDTINSVQYRIIESGTCPSGCDSTTVANTFYIAGVPSSIDPGETSTGLLYETVTCIQTDANGGKTPVAPDSFSTQAYPSGWLKSTNVGGGTAYFQVYP